MKFLIDTNPPKIERWVKEAPDFVAGQLIVPASTRRNWGGVFGLDNSAFVSFNERKFKNLQNRQVENKSRCKFVTCPDIVGSAKRTMEIWRHRDRFQHGFELSLVFQNGIEDMDIPWEDTPAVFIGGVDPWKESDACRDIVKTAKILGKHVHIGRVNQIKRFRYFHELGADTCDGSSIALHDYKLYDIINRFTDNSPTLFDMKTKGDTDE